MLGFTAGYFGGAVDSVIRTVADVILPIPALAVLVVIASTIHVLLSVEIMALVIASLACPSVEPNVLSGQTSPLVRRT